MSLHNPVYYFTHNKMDLLLQQLTQNDPQTPQWDNALAHLHLTIRAKPEQQNTEITLIEKPCLTLTRPKHMGTRETLLLDRPILAPMAKKDKPPAKIIQNLQKGSFLTQHYQLKAPDVMFDIERLVMLRDEEGAKRMMPLPVYVVQPHIRPSQQQPERLIRFMRSHSPTPESHPVLSGFGHNGKALLHYYVMQLK
jgi:hypothetical protein